MVVSGAAPGVLAGWATAGLPAAGSSGPSIRVAALALVCVLLWVVRAKAGAWDIWAVRISGAITLVYLLASGITMQAI